MKICSVCNEIVSANQRCALSNCPNKGSARPAPKSRKVIPGPTGRSDRAVQAGLDRAGDLARNATRRAAFAIAVIFAVVAAIAAIGFNLAGDNRNKNADASAAVDTSPQAMVPEASSQNSIPAQSGDLRTMSCNQLWYARNSIFAEKGKCFKTQRAIAAFGLRCHPPYGDLTQSEKIRVSEISYWEGQAGCH